ncbi:PAM71, chloroplastic-like protein [Drosera capensis]
MPTATLMAHAMPSMCPHSLSKSPNFSSSRFIQRNSRFTLSSSASSSSWSSSRVSGLICTEELESEPSSFMDSGDLDCRIVDCESIHADEAAHCNDGFYGPYASPLKCISEHSNPIQTLIPFSETAFSRLLKYSLLFGSLTFQGVGPALAASDFVSGWQSVNFFGDLNDITTGFASAFLLIFFSELGDKTFFIAALLAARNSAAAVFTGTFGALAFGENDLPVDDIAAVLLLVYFGVSTLIDATSSDGLKAEEEQREAELAVSEFSGNGAGIIAAANTVISTFLLVFVAEWGDKSFFSTIALAAASSPLGVIGGAFAGHGVATLLAVLGGSLLGSFLSEKELVGSSQLTLDSVHVIYHA